jgi:hypothetical protein
MASTTGTQDVRINAAAVVAHKQVHEAWARRWLGPRISPHLLVSHAQGHGGTREALQERAVQVSSNARALP